MRYFLFIFLLLTVLSPSKGQLIFSFPDPWPGAYKTAVAEDTVNNFAYITTWQTFNPHAKWKLFRINLNTNAVDSLANSGLGPGFITSRMICKNGFLYMINAQDRIEAFSLATNTFTWSVSVDYPAWERIHDFALKSDTIFLGGDFSGLNTIPRWSIAAISRINGSIFTSWDPSSNGALDFSMIKSLRVGTNGNLYVGGRFLVAGRQNLAAIDIAGEFLTSWSPNPNDTVQDIEIANSYLYISGNFNVTSNFSRNRVARYDLSTHALTSYSMGANGPVNHLEVYPGLLMMSGSFTQIGSQARTNMGSVALVNNLPTAWNPGAVPVGTRLVRSLNRLYAFNESSLYFSVYCLPPVAGPGFINPDLSACAGDTNSIYSVFPSLYANSYYWTYSGSGVFLNPSGSSCSVSFNSNATSGSLSVVPVSYCGNSAAPITISITVNQPPDADAGIPDTINCYQPVIYLSGTSTNLNSVMAWSGPQSCPAHCAMFPVSDGGEYYLQVTDTLTGCFSEDSVMIIKDTILPSVVLPAGPFTLSCGTSSVLLDGSSFTPNTIQQWRAAADTVYYYDPFTCTNAGTYFFIVQSLDNGCADSSYVSVQLDLGQPNAYLTSHPDTFPSPAGYFNCYADTILLSGGTDSTNCIVFWKNISTLQMYPDPAVLTAGGIYRMMVVDTVTGCSDSSLFVLFASDTAPPIIQMPLLQSFNCSQDTLLLDASVISPNSTLSWSGPNSFSSPDPALITDTGLYILQCFRNDNGCTVSDSVSIGFQPVLNVSAGSDTMICQGSSAFLTGNVTGNNGPFTWSWSNQANTQSTTVHPMADSLFVLTVNGTNGCSGSDSILVTIAPPLQDTLILFAACDGSDSGSVQIIPSGGIPPYVYSIDSGMSFQPVNIYQQLPFGTYHIVIKDFLGCTLRDAAVLNASLSPPQVNFLVRTINAVEDTVVIVSLTNPPADTIAWTFDSPVSWIDSSIWSPAIVFPDTGQKMITMHAWYNDCMLQTEKAIYVGEADTMQASLYNENGIQSLTLSPNPNTGSFALNIGFFKSQDFVLQVFDAGMAIHFQQFLSERLNYSASVALQNPQPGTWFLRVISEFDARMISFIILP